ncbi:DUF2996 domain-containing protein [Chamaesiphon polymorphus]|uniref:DUF2996 domain-containing protein n=1 Tax=Chamaesiphon polymorphus CCALA 037 TaxID=2107692 RepID=A0A2T1G0G9_9CYAN|nr:DUF2996 domain-containing protein [Chamaesiphon polymorphus]PSB50748.1 DUF2996 domain-containing protein [Chamaesiphon polymorphus CCALA 037]
MLEESLENVTPTAPATDPPSAKKAVKEKPPAVESKPFAEFIQQDYFPALTKALAERGVTDLHVALERSKIAVKGFETAPECSQVIGSWNGGKRQFNIYFLDDDIQGQRAISCVDFGHIASTIESFLVLDRKMTLDLLVLGLVLRLNSQKWLLRN